MAGVSTIKSYSFLCNAVHREWSQQLVAGMVQVYLVDACAGEIGQVGKATYLHGFTAAVGILREDSKAEEESSIPQETQQTK